MFATKRCFSEEVVFFGHQGGHDGLSFREGNFNHQEEKGLFSCVQDDYHGGLSSRRCMI